MTRKNNWITSFWLSIPLLVFYLGYCLNHIPDLQPTGYIQYDNVGYAAYMKQYIHEGGSLLYSNPFNDGPGYPKIYFQTQNFLLLLLTKLGIPEGWSVCLFSYLFFTFSIFVLINIFDHLYPHASKRGLKLLLMTWGGGMLVLAGILILPFRPMPELDLLDRVFYLDPGWGWWGLSLGRGMIPGTEAYYHFLFFLSIYFLLKKKWWATAITCFVLSVSHPFTGIQLFSVILLWCGVEKLFLKKQDLPWVFIAVMTGILFFHLWYYMIYLPSFADHKSVGEQYALNWNYRFYHFIPAYILVAGLFIFSVYLKGRSYFASSANRFFLSMAVVSLLLSNHELFMKPMQPIHFTRGYEWTAYFFLGLPALHELIKRLQPRKILLIAFACLFLLDNFLWIFNCARGTARQTSTGYTSSEQRKVLQAIREHGTAQTLIIGSDEEIPYLAKVDLPSYAWRSHPYTTPYSQQKLEAYQQFLDKGITPGAWKKRPLLFVVSKKNRAEWARSLQLPFPAEKISETKNYILLKGMIP